MAKFTNVYLRFSALSFLKNKSSSSVLNSFIKFEIYFVTSISFGRRVQYLRSDQRNEYTNRDFKEYCKRAGILQQFTVPYTSQKNEICERVGEIKTNMPRCFLV